MGNGVVTIEQLHQDLLSLFKEVREIKRDVEELRDAEQKVRPEYTQKIKKIDQGRFLSRAELDKELED